MAITQLLSRWFQTEDTKQKKSDHPFFISYVKPFLKKDKRGHFSYYNRAFKWSADPTYQSLKKADPESKKAFVFWLVQDIVRLNSLRRLRRNMSSTHIVSVQQAVEEELLKLLMRSNLPFSLDEMVELFFSIPEKEKV